MKELNIEKLHIAVGDQEMVRVVGVARDSKYRSISEPRTAHVYRPTPPTLGLTLLARSTTDLRPIFAHELLHYRRRDHWVGFLQLMVAAVWWFHPLVWWMNRQVSRTREMSCDEQAIASLACPPAGAP